MKGIFIFKVDLMVTLQKINYLSQNFGWGDYIER